MKKGLIIAAAMILAVCLGVGGTLAYLFVKTSTVTNTFSPSDITLTLVETNVDGDSNLANEYQMVPGKDIVKDPKVSANGNLPYYVFVKVDKVNNPDTYLDYTINTGANAWTAVPGVANVYYIAVDGGELAATSVLTGDKVTTKDEITKTQMEALKTSGALPKLIFTAYAVQKDGFDTIKAAWEVALAQQNP